MLYKIMFRSEARTVIDAINDSRIDLGTFSCWDGHKQSNFLELVMMGVPIREIFSYENNEGEIKLMNSDGSNRLQTLKVFVTGGVRRYLWGSQLRFSELRREVQNQLKGTKLIFHIIDRTTPKEEVAEIAERIR